LYQLTRDCIIAMLSCMPTCLSVLWQTVQPAAVLVDSSDAV